MLPAQAEVQQQGDVDIGQGGGEGGRVLQKATLVEFLHNTCAPNLLFFNEKKIQRDSMIFVIEKSLC